MPKLVPVVTVIVRRDDEKGVSQRIKPEIGKEFDFTADEIKDIKAANPEALRKPVNESGKGEGGKGDGGEGGNGGETPKTEAEINDGTKAVIKGLIGADFSGKPNIDTTNKALKANGLPEIKADKRDAVIAEIKAESEL
jgi:hypothetical protein